MIPVPSTPVLIGFQEAFCEMMERPKPARFVQVFEPVADPLAARDNSAQGTAGSEHARNHSAADKRRRTWRGHFWMFSATSAVLCASAFIIPVRHCQDAPLMAVHIAQRQILTQRRREPQRSQRKVCSSRIGNAFLKILRGARRFSIFALQIQRLLSSIRVYRRP